MLGFEVGVIFDAWFRAAAHVLISEQQTPMAGLSFQVGFTNVLIGELRLGERGSEMGEGLLRCRRLAGSTVPISVRLRLCVFLVECSHGCVPRTPA